MPDKIATIEHTFQFRSMHLLVCHTACHLLCFNMIYYLPDSCSIYIQDFGCHVAKTVPKMGPFSGWQGRSVVEKEASLTEWCMRSQEKRKF